MPVRSNRRPITGTNFLSFAQDFLLVSEQRRKQITDDPTRARLNLDSDGHARGQIDELVLHLHLGAIKRDARRVVELLAVRFAGTIFCAWRLIIGFIVTAQVRIGGSRGPQGG